MIKKLVPLLALSSPTYGTIIPFDFEANQKDNGVITLSLQEYENTINLTQLYLKNSNILFKELDLVNPSNEKHQLFSTSMRIYDTNSDDKISFSFNIKDMKIDSLEYGIGYYNPNGYQYDRGTIVVNKEENLSINEPFSFGIFTLGLYCLYSQRKNSLNKKLRK